MTLFSTSSVLGLAWFAAANLVATVLVWLMARLVVGRGLQRRPGLMLTLRLLPSSGALVFVGLVFLPAHWKHELPGTPESFGIVLLALAGGGLVLWLRSAWRIASAVHLSLTVSRWPRRHATQGIVPFIEVDAVGLSLAGILRPTIVLGSRVREVLTPAELDVALAHEVAHRRGWDNLKRFAMHCAPDLLGLLRVGRALEAAWRAETECLADARATQGDSARALNLAAALVKVARLADANDGLRSTPLWSTFHEPSLIEARVRRLLTGASTPIHTVSEPLVAASLAVALTSGICITRVPYDLYQLTETLIRLLP